MKKISREHTHFPVEELLIWYKANKKDLPWRKTTDPYCIWVSEIMCQQTRVEQAVPYYNRFIDVFPDVFALANASQHALLTIWEGLGYYSRARNLQHAAKRIVHEYGGVVPSDPKKFAGLRGVGNYTNAAVMSIAYQLPMAVVDGNVLRVLSRYFGIEDEIRSAKTKQTIQHLANTIIPHASPGDFNQALMELGATICLPKNPTCNSCPVQHHCVAWRLNRTDQIPVKAPKKKVPHYDVVVGVIRNKNNKLLISLRPDHVMLGGLWEFPGGKVLPNESHQKALQREINEELQVEADIQEHIASIKHTYSHFKITLHAYFCTLRSGKPKAISGVEIRWVYIPELLNFPFPKANRTLTQILIERNGEIG